MQVPTLDQLPVSSDDTEIYERTFRLVDVLQTSVEDMRPEWQERMSVFEGLAVAWVGDYPGGQQTQHGLLVEIAVRSISAAWELDTDAEREYKERIEKSALYDLLAPLTGYGFFIDQGVGAFKLRAAQGDCLAQEIIRADRTFADSVSMAGFEYRVADILRDFNDSTAQALQSWIGDAENEPLLSLVPGDPEQPIRELLEYAAFYRGRVARKVYPIDVERLVGVVATASVEAGLLSRRV